MATDRETVQTQAGLHPGVFRRWSLLASALGVVLLLFAVLYVWLRVQQVKDGYALARYQAEYREQYDLHRKLELEWSSLHDPSYLEQLGRNRFGLKPPQADQQFLMPRSGK